MASTVFTNQQTVIQASWLNDVNKATYTTLPAVVTQSANNNTTLTNIESPTGSSLVGYTQGSTYSSNRSVQSKLQESVSVKDFGAKGDGITDDTAAMQAAHNTGNLIYYPAGTYLFTTLSTTITAGGIFGDGPTKTVLKSTDLSSNNLFSFTGAWQNNLPNESNSAFLFKDFSIEANLSATKTGGAAIQINAPSTYENQLTYFENVLFRTVPIGIDFTAASFWKVIGCSFIGHTIAGIQVANSYNGDSGDSCVTNCIFETNPVSSGTTGITQFSSGGLKITGCKFLGGTYGYKMAWNSSNSSSNLQICNNSFELMEYAAIALSRASGTSTFKLITITGNEIALTTSGIASDSNTWLSEIVIVGNVIELWANYSSTTYAIGFNNVSNYIISNNNITGTGTTSTGLSLVNSTNGQIGLNNYLNLSSAISQSGATPAIVQLSEQSGQKDTASTGWTSYGSLYQSTTTTVTFTTPFFVAPNAYDITLTAGDGSGTVAGIVAGSITTTGFSFIALNVYNNKASTIYWTAKGII